MTETMTRQEAVEHNVRMVTEHGVDNELLDKLVDVRALFEAVAAGAMKALG